MGQLTPFSSALPELAHPAEEMGGVMAKSGLWFDLPNSPYAVGYGIINGSARDRDCFGATMKGLHCAAASSRYRLSARMPASVDYGGEVLDPGCPETLKNAMGY